MSTERNLLIVRRYFDEVCNAKKLHEADELFSPKHVLHDPSIPGVRPGPEGIKEVVSVYQNAFPDAFWKVEDMLASEDKVVVRWTGTGTHKNELQGNPPVTPTGRKVKVAGVWIFRLENNLIVESWDVWDTFGMLQQLGVIPKAETV